MIPPRDGTHASIHTQTVRNRQLVPLMRRDLSKSKNIFLKEKKQ